MGLGVIDALALAFLFGSLSGNQREVGAYLWDPEQFRAVQDCPGLTGGYPCPISDTQTLHILMATVGHWERLRKAQEAKTRGNPTPLAA